MQWLDPDAKYWHRLWSVRISLFGAALSGLWAAIPAFQYILPPVPFICLSIAVSLAVVGARLLDQPSIPRAGDPYA
jgi:hypothetical protein